MPLTLIDYGISNLRSVVKAIEHLGLEVELAQDPEVVTRAERLILPGVGAFEAGMRGLRERGLDRALREVAQAGRPVLGICLGMQLLFDESQEMGLHAGLGLIPGRVVRLAPGELPVPHMGWNQLEPRRASRLLRGLRPGDYAYFVHSYMCRPSDPADVLAETDYGGLFAAIVGRENVLGLQFHPEKSQAVGLNLLGNFARL